MAWPGVPLLQPRYLRHAAYRFDRSGQVLIPDGDRMWATASGETYLRLSALDVDDSAAALAFVNKHGLLEGGFAYGDLRQINFARQFDFERHLALWGEVAETDALYRERQQAEGGVPLETLDSFAFVLRTFRDLTNAWRVFHEGVDPATISWELQSPEQEGIDHAAFLLQTVLPRLLTTFRPSVRVEHPASRARDADAEGLNGAAQMEGDWSQLLTVEATRGPELPWLYQLCALELYNHIVEKAAYQTCRNETCGRLFVRQLGRAEHGQSRREGVMYCTAACANAQAQRMHRRRKRAKSK